VSELEVYNTHNMYECTELNYKLGGRSGFVSKTLTARIDYLTSYCCQASSLSTADFL